MSAVLGFPVKPEAQPYFDAFDLQAAGEPDWLTASRRRGLTRFAEVGFPTRSSENWRYLDLQPLAENPLPPVHRRPNARLDWAREHLSSLVLPGKGPRLVIVDGIAAPELSSLAMPAGVWFGSTKSAIEARPALLLGAMGDAQGDRSHPFAALNVACHSDGYILDVASGIAVDEAIEIVHLASGDLAGSFHTRSLVTLGEGATAKILEVYAGAGRYWRNDVIAVRLAANAVLARNVVVEEAGEAVHLGQLDARLGGGAQLTGFALMLGGRTVRQEANICLAGDGARCQIDGAYIVAGNDEANIVTEVDHAAPGGQTRELIKGVAAGRGHGAFQGRIVVREHAQKTDAHQLSRNLIIGDRAAIDTKPELEIYADDVKCSHGASVGDLDEAALFYLRARGIPPEEARHMLIDAFLREAVETVDDLAIRTHLLRRLAARLALLEGAA